MNFTHQVIGSVHTNTILAPNPTFKVGVTNNADVEVNVPFAGIHTFGSSTGPSSTIWGIGDTFVRAKVNLWGNDGGSTAAALIPLCQSAFRADRNRQWRSGRRLDRPARVEPAATISSLLLVPEIDALKNSVDNGRHGNFIFDVNLSREVIEKRHGLRRTMVGL